MKVDPSTNALDVKGFEFALLTVANGELAPRDDAEAGLPKILEVAFWPKTLLPLLDICAADANPPVDANDAKPLDVDLLWSACLEVPKG